MEIPPLEITLKKNCPSGGLFYIPSIFIHQRILFIGKKYKITIEEVKQ